MRITHQMLSKIAIDGMQTNLHQLSKVQRKAVTGKEVNRPEDDPFAVEQSLGFRSRIKSGEASLRNIDLSKNWLNATDKALDDMSSILTRARSLALQGANETLGPEERQTLALEINGILEEAIAVGNTRHGDHFLFSGFQIKTTPFEANRDPGTDFVTAVTYNGDNGLMQREAEPGTEITINVVGDPVFSDVFDRLIDLRDALQADPFVVDDVTTAMSDIKAGMDDLLDVQAEAGTKLRRLDNTSQRIEDFQVGLTELLSKAEDADMTEVISELQQRQFVYQTALSVNAKVTQTSLMDFLR